MRIQDYVQVLFKRWWVIALVAFSAAVAAYGISKATTPMFRSQAFYGVQFSRLDTGAGFFANQILNGYVGLVHQPDRMQQISDQLGLDLTGQALMEDVRLQPQPDQMRIVIEADSYDPATAQAIANAVGQLLYARVVQANLDLQGEDKVNLQLAQTALPAWRAKPNTRINVLAGALLGGVLGVLLCFVLEALDDTLKTSADVERFAGLTLIGAIPTTGMAEGRRQTVLRPAFQGSGVGGQGSVGSRRMTNDE